MGFLKFLLQPLGGLWALAKTQPVAAVAILIIFVLAVMAGIGILYKSPFFEVISLLAFLAGVFLVVFKMLLRHFETKKT